MYDRIPLRVGRLQCQRRPLIWAVGFAISSILTSCQTYEPRPLDPETHRTTWHRRTLEGDSLREFVDRLDRHSDLRTPRFDPDDGLTLPEGQRVALLFNPDLRLARLGVERAQATAEYASLWRDPVLSLDVLRITESTSDPWFIAPALSFSIPISGRLDSEQKIADSAQAASHARLLESEWRVLRTVREAWATWSSNRLRIDETERFIESMGSLVETTDRLAATGELDRTEAALFSLELIRRQNDLIRLQGESEATELTLRARLGLPPKAPITLVPELDPGNGEVDSDLDEDVATRNLTLARLKIEYDISEATLQREIKEQWPDLNLGPSYESDEGQSRLGFSLSIPIPLLNQNRQSIEEARVDRERARAAHETTYERIIGRLNSLRARTRALLRQRGEMESKLVPRIDQQVEDAFDLLRLGEGTSLVLLTSLIRAYETKIALIQNRLTQTLTRAELDFLLGPIRPESTLEEKDPTP